MPRKIVAAIMIAVGVWGLFAIATHSTEPRWRADDPARSGHVTAMTWWQDAPLVAQQDGTVWTRDGSDWQVHSTLSDEARSTVLFSGTELLAGTAADGVQRLDGQDWIAEEGDDAPTGRISHVTGFGDGRVFAAGNGGVWERAGDGDWRFLGHPDPDVPVYRVVVRDEDGDTVIRSGSIEAGVHVYRPDDDAWQADNDGLPDASKILSFQELADSSLVAGTDAGLFRQQRVGERWQRIGGILGDRRVLDMAVTDDRLYAASDDGVWRAPIRDGGLADEPDWLPVLAAAGELDASVSWVLTDDESPWIAAGSVYQLRSGRTPEWYLLVIGTPLMLIGGFGLWLLRR